MIALCQSNLSRIDPAIARPEYDRSEIKPGIVHIGCGNFHRAHQSWYLEQLFRKGMCKDFGIVGAGVRANDAAMRERLAAQDWMTTLISLSPKHKSAEIVGSMIDFVPVEEGNGPLIERMADPMTKIVALTVTEGGYYLDPATKGLDASHPDILHDAANPGKPKTAFGAMIEALKRRRDAGRGPFTGLCCDNLQGNGDVLKGVVLALARLSNPALADWIDANCTFPNSMVDCIVPATGPQELALVREFGIDDAAPVTHEPFRQWVIEDNFCAGRPDWDKAGATFTPQVHDFELMKIRMLNGGHQVLGMVGALLGIEIMSETMADARIYPFFRKCEEQEIVPHVKAVPEYTAMEYLELIDGRFKNPAIVDTTRRIAFDGSSRQPGFILPSVRDGLSSGAPVEGLALVSAVWARYCCGTTEDGTAIEPNDPIWGDLQRRALAAKVSPTAWLDNRAIYGDLCSEPRFADAFAAWLKMLHSEGVAAALAAYVS
nr:mannitol dehydrogenase family protein [Burkholderia ambifaria]